MAKIDPAQVAAGLQRAAAARGGRTWGNPPFGYIFRDGRRVRDPDEQRTLRAARLLVDRDGLSLRAAAEELRRRGILGRRGRALCFQSLGRLLARARAQRASLAAP